MDIENKITEIPTGFSEVEFRGNKYGMSRTDFADGRSTKVYAEELGGNDYISFNYYRTSGGGLLRTCEMSKEKVLKFLSGI